MVFPEFVAPDALIVAAVSLFLLLTLSATLVLIVISMGRPSDVPLLVATGLVVLSAVVVIVSPYSIPLLFGLVIAMLGTAVAVLGGNPLTRRVLQVATHGRVRDGDGGGILVDVGPQTADDSTDNPTREVMRGGTVIGYLERIAVVLAIVAGYPEAIAVVVAVKGIGRFSELATPDARERFIIGTLASLVWACVVGAIVRLAIW